MGIRVHKALGYGLTDLVKEDPRVDWGCRVLADGYTEASPSGQEYFSWLHKRYASPKDPKFSLDFLSLRTELRTREATLEDCVTIEGENGPDGVLAVRPLSMTSRWLRSDDDIDYATETLDLPVDSHCERLPGCIYPFTGFYMDAATGERLPTQEAMAWYRFSAALRARDATEGTDSTDERDRLAQVMVSLPTDEQARLRVVPEVPSEVRDVIEFLGLFTSEDTWMTLRPVLATWWA